MISWDWTPSELDRRERVQGGETVLANCDGRGCDKRLIEWAKEKGLFVYIGRGGGRTGYRRSDWHNPASLAPKDKHNAEARARALASYEAHLAARPDLLARLKGPELRGKVLGCHCHPEPCHGDVLIARLAAVGQGR
jgi:hypothetical protein